MTPLELFNERRNTPHNIDQHLDAIKYYASLCNHVTEFGVERGWSTSALLASGAATVRSYDLVRWPEVDLIEEVAGWAGIDFRFILADTACVRIEPTDLLFVDSDHTYKQVDAELFGNLDQVKRFVVFHDVISFPSIVAAIAKHCWRSGWSVRRWDNHQNGLAVLERSS